MNEIQVVGEVDEILHVTKLPAREGRRCIDGRYDSQTRGGYLARPGGDLGYVLGLLALSNQEGWGLSPFEAYRLIHRIVEKRGGFHFHSDHLEREGSGQFGCGHLALASHPELASQYGVTQLQVQQLIAYAERVALGLCCGQLDYLHGEHRELGLIVNHSRSSSFGAPSVECPPQYFVYDRGRDEDFVNWLSGELRARGLAHLKAERFQAILDQQMNITVHHLIGDKPIYRAAA